MTYTTSNPWINHVINTVDEKGLKFLDQTQLEMNAMADRIEFYKVLTEGLAVKLNGKNLGFIAGYASQGYGNWSQVEEALNHWITDMNTENPDGWICLTNGDGDYGHPSVYTIACHIADQGIPIVFVQSHFGYAEVGSKYWPSNSSAGLYGQGLYNLTKNGVRPCWGGFVKNDPYGTEIHPRSGQLSFPDQALTELPFSESGVRLEDHLCGVFMAGGGDIVCEQAEILRLCSGKRKLDRYCNGCTLPLTEKVESIPSVMNRLYRPHQRTK